MNGNPVRTDAALRKLERDAAAVQVNDPYVSSSNEPAHAVPRRQGRREDAAHGDRGSAADAVVHVVRAIRTSSSREPRTQVRPARLNCRLVAPGVSSASTTTSRGATAMRPTDIGATWLGMAGPGVENLGQTSKVWSDHTDIQPTMLALAGLKDDYAPDGRVLTEFLENTRCRRPAQRARDADRARARSTSRSTRRSASSRSTCSPPRRGRSRAGARPTTARTRRSRTGSRR